MIDSVKDRKKKQLETEKTTVYFSIFVEFLDKALFKLLCSSCTTQKGA